MQNNKSPGNDGLSKEFYEIFWDDIKVSFLLSVKQSYTSKILSVSQRQAVIKLIEKKVETKGLLKTGDLFLYLMLMPN